MARRTPAKRTSVPAGWIVLTRWATPSSVKGGGVEPDHLGLIDGEKVAAAGPVVDDERVDGTDLGVPGQDLGDTSRLVKRENLRT